MKIKVLNFKSNGEVPDEEFEYDAETYPRVGEVLRAVGRKEMLVRRATHIVNTMLASDLNNRVELEVY